MAHVYWPSETLHVRPSYPPSLIFSVMAYGRGRSYGRRRSYRRRPRFTPRFTRKRGRVTRFRRRRPRMTPNRVRRISARKCWDTQEGTDDAGTTGEGLRFTAGTTYILNCPTYLYQSAAPSLEGRRHHRNRQKIFFRGVKENVFISAKLHVTWRRVVFLSHDRFDSAVPIVEPGSSGVPYMLRNLRPQDPPPVWCNTGNW